MSKHTSIRALLEDATLKMGTPPRPEACLEITKYHEHIEIETKHAMDIKSMTFKIILNVVHSTCTDSAQMIHSHVFDETIILT